METVAMLKRALSATGEVLKAGQGIQEPARMGLVKDLHSVCLKCEGAYETVLLRLVPVKNAFNDPDQLAMELRLLASDTETRDAFKPEHLCGEVDELLTRLESNLDPLKYSLDVNRLGAIREHLNQAGSFDAAIYESYDQFMRDLDGIATQIQMSTEDKTERAEYVRTAIVKFEEELRSGIDDIRRIKDDIISGR
jgi:hypothetical protein